MFHKEEQNLPRLQRFSKVLQYFRSLKKILQGFRIFKRFSKVVEIFQGFQGCKCFPRFSKVVEVAKGFAIFYKLTCKVVQNKKSFKKFVKIFQPKVSDFTLIFCCF